MPAFLMFLMVPAVPVPTVPVPTVPVPGGSGSRRFAGTQPVPTVPVPTVPVSGSRFHSRPYCISVVTEATKVAQKLSGSCPKVDRKLPGS